MSIFKNKNVTGGPDQRYVLLDPILGELAIFQKEKNFLESQAEKADFIKLSMITSCMLSQRKEMNSKKLQSVDLTFANDKFILILGTYCSDQAKLWCEAVINAKKFSDWLTAIRQMMASENDRLAKKQPAELNKHLMFKLKEILEFCESFSSSEAFEIPLLSLKQAQANDDRRKQEAKKMSKQSGIDILKSSLASSNSKQ